MNKQSLIDFLKLEPHPEGGYFRQLYVSPIEVNDVNISGQMRPSFSTIYSMLGLKEFNHLHRLRMDEILHHYAGVSITIVVLDKDLPEQHYKIKLGKNVLKGECPQYVVQAGVWFGFYLDDSDLVENGDDFALIGATVSPAFDYKYNEIAERDFLLSEFPKAADIINKLTVQ